ncbi:MAG: hypothetical protein AAB217_09695, partial [Chloroflexota bacterium]
VYYRPGRVLRGKLPNLKRAQEVFEKDGELWIGEMASEQTSVFILLFPFANISVPIATSTLTPG